MSEIANVIQVDDSHRYLVEYDNDCPMDLVVSDSLGFQSTRVARFMNGIHTDDKYGEVFARIIAEQQPNDYVGGWDKVERIFALYLRLSGVPYKHIELNGYSQGEWCEGIAYLADGSRHYKHYREFGKERLDSHITSLRDWWRGDVYRVTSQELVTYYTADGKKTYQQWEQVEGSDTFVGITGDITLDTCEELFGY